MLFRGNFDDIMNVDVHPPRYGGLVPTRRIAFHEKYRARRLINRTRTDA
jgi:hypothetical protein